MAEDEAEAGAHHHGPGDGKVQEEATEAASEAPKSARIVLRKRKHQRKNRTVFRIKKQTNSNTHNIVNLSS